MSYSPVRYKRIDDLDAKIERIVGRKVKHYYTDWKNYDRPKYMKFKGSNDKNDKKFLLLTRECGTYIVRTCDIYKNEWATTLFEYYQTQEPSDYHYVDLNELKITKIDPREFAVKLKKQN